MARDDPDQRLTLAGPQRGASILLGMILAGAGVCVSE
jgi:hypothetical protein